MSLRTLLFFFFFLYKTIWVKPISSCSLTSQATARYRLVKMTKLSVLLNCKIYNNYLNPYINIAIFF